MKRVADDDKPDFPLRFGENVLVCAADVPDRPRSLKDCWLEAILVEGEDSQGRFCVNVQNEEYLLKRDSIQKKDTSVRPSAAGETVLVYHHTKDGVHWKQAVLKTFLPYDMTDEHAVRKCEVDININDRPVVYQYPVNICILGRHCAQDSERMEKRIKTLA